jgi:DNA-binding PadR family transcriptional regulator
MDPKLRPSPLALAVLGLLVVGPLHPYAMQRLLKHWGKDRVINVGQRANLYKTIRRLHEAGLVAVRQTERDQQFPERTVYELTEPGRQVMQDWLAVMLAAPRNEFPQFPAALSFVMLLDPERAEAALASRAAVLRENLARLERSVADYAGTLPRVTLLDDEYLRAVTAAELSWVSGVIEDLRAGTLQWGEELAELARSGLPDLTPAAGQSPAAVSDSAAT